MQIRQIINFCLPLLGVVIFTFSGITSVFQYRNYRTLECQRRQLHREVQAADTTVDNHEAVNRYKTLQPLLPEVQLRILQRQWSIALEILRQIQLAKDNEALEKDVPVLTNKLKDHLDDMKDRCNTLLAESESLQDDIVWRVYNLNGSVKLLLAFLVLETERNWEKVQGIMKEAISDLKSSTDTVDRVKEPTFARNIPRWNLELLSAEQYVRKFEIITPSDETRVELEENLEAIIPEKGGYAPGEPLERRIKK
jgi:hypothetical protein